MINLGFNVFKKTKSEIYTVRVLGLCWMMSTPVLTAPSSLSAGRPQRCYSTPSSALNPTSGPSVSQLQHIRSNGVFIPGLHAW